jgi:hypothetical protein
VEDFFSERKRISGLFSQMSSLKDRTAVGLERPLQFQDSIFMEDLGTIQCPLSFGVKEPELLFSFLF